MVPGISFPHVSCETSAQTGPIIPEFQSERKTSYLQRYVCGHWIMPSGRRSAAGVRAAWPIPCGAYAPPAVSLCVGQPAIWRHSQRENLDLLRVSLALEGDLWYPQLGSRLFSHQHEAVEYCTTVGLRAEGNGR